VPIRVKLDTKENSSAELLLKGLQDCTMLSCNSEKSEVSGNLAETLSTSEATLNAAAPAAATSPCRSAAAQRQPRAMDDLRKYRKAKYFERELKATCKSNPTRRSLSERRKKNRTPTKREGENEGYSLRVKERSK
jgi:hypothetical protein